MGGIYLLPTIYAQKCRTRPVPSDCEWAVKQQGRATKQRDRAASAKRLRILGLTMAQSELQKCCFLQFLRVNLWYKVIIIHPWFKESINLGSTFITSIPTEGPIDVLGENDPDCHKLTNFTNTTIGWDQFFQNLLRYYVTLYQPWEFKQTLRNVPYFHAKFDVCLSFSAVFDILHYDIKPHIVYFHKPKTTKLYPPLQINVTYLHILCRAGLKPAHHF